MAYIAAAVASPNLRYLFPGELLCGLPLSPKHVVHVLAMGALNQVLGVEAGRVITGVTNFPFGQPLIPFLENNPMYVLNFAVKPNLAISSTVSSPGPFNAPKSWQQVAKLRQD